MAALFATGGAHAETRTLKLYFIHTKEKAEITYKRNGRFDQAGLRKVNQFLRDWRRNEPTKMDPRLLDLVWETYRAVGARDYIHVVSAYRSPATNSMLRGRSKGVAKKSQHMLGKAMDFYIPGVSLKKLRDTSLKMQTGGVGYYPRSGSPFVHLDVGNVRHWPKMSRKELASVFPNGKTLHIPSDGKPLPGFEQAVASYEARKKSGTTALALASSPEKGKPSRNLLAALFGGGPDEDEEAAIAEQAAPAAKPAPRAAEPKVADPKPAPAVKPTPKEEVPGILIVAPEDANRVDLPVVAEEPAAPEPVQETPETIIAALSPRSIPIPELAPRPKADIAAPQVVAMAADPATPAQPADMPFGMAQDEDAAAVAAGPQPPESVPFGMASDADVAAVADEADTAPVAEVALNVPVPTPRPDLGRKPEPEGAAQDAVLMALVSAERDMPRLTDASAQLAELRDSTEPADAPLGVVPMNRPDLTVGSVRRSPEEELALATALRESEQRVAALANADLDRRDMKTAAIVSTNDGAPRTTRKAARPTPRDGKPGRKPVVVAAEPDAARWALTTHLVTDISQETRAPSFAYNAVVTAPREIYTAGFKADERQADPNRFSGTAVEFLSVARFE